MTETIQLVLGIEFLGISLFLFICSSILMLIQAYKLLKG